MGDVLPMPNPGDVFTDVRGGERTMRVSYHQDAGILVVSLWAGGTCRASFRVPPGELDRLIGLFTTVAGSLAADGAPPAEAD